MGPQDHVGEQMQELRIGSNVRQGRRGRHWRYRLGYRLRYEREPVYKTVIDDGTEAVGSGVTT